MSQAYAVVTVGLLRGRVDHVARDRIEGWAQDTDAPETPVILRLLNNGICIGEVAADQHRADLTLAGIGSGRHGFVFQMAAPLAQDRTHLIQVTRASDSAILNGSPWLLSASEPGGPPRMETSFQGHAAHVTRQWIAGWAWDRACSDEPVTIEILDNGVRIATLPANAYRPDLVQAGIGDGRHGFEFFIPGGLDPSVKHVVRIRRESDGAELRDSPKTIEASDRFDQAMEQRVAEAIEALEPGPAQDRVLSFVAGQTAHLLRQRAEAEGNRAARMAHAHFCRRWGGSAAPDEGGDAGLQALVVDDDMPDPGRNAGSQAILSHMRSLRRLGYTVTFVAANDLSAESAAIAALEQQGFSVCHAPYYGSVEEVLRLRNICFDAVYLNRVSNAAKYMALARCHCPKALILYGVADLHYLRLERQAAVEERPELLARSRRIRLVESTCAWSADAVLTHSAFEAGLLRQAIRDANVHVLPWDVPVRLVQAEASARTGVAFIGGYAHHPNVDAARYLAEAVMPMVWRQDSTIGCTLAGSDMPPEIADLAGPRLTVLGQVHDLYTVLNRARLTVAPLRYGAGVKGKVLASLAAGVPCVMTSVAAEGIGLPDALQALVRDDAAGLAEAILQLHEDVPRCLEAAKAGVAFVAEHFTEEIVDVALTRALGGRVGTSTQLHLAAAE